MRRPRRTVFLARWRSWLPCCSSAALLSALYVDYQWYAADARDHRVAGAPEQCRAPDRDRSRPDRRPLRLRQPVRGPPLDRLRRLPAAHGQSRYRRGGTGPLSHRSATGAVFAGARHHPGAAARALDRVGRRHATGSPFGETEPYFQIGSRLFRLLAPARDGAVRAPRSCCSSRCLSWSSCISP